MKRLFLSALVFLSISGVAHAQTQISITCGSNLFTQNLYSNADAQAFKDRCTAAGGQTQTGSQGTDSTGPYILGICSDPNACKSQNSTGPAYTSATQPTQAQAAKLSYTPLEPLPGGTSNSYNSLSGYLALMFNILLSLGAMIAVVTLVLAGITYMISEVVNKKSEARNRMRASIIGLLLLLSCWLILNTINPNLVKFNLPIPGASSSLTNGQGSGSSQQQPPSQAQAAQGEAACKANGPFCAWDPSPNGFSCDCFGI